MVGKNFQVLGPSTNGEDAGHATVKKDLEVHVWETGATCGVGGIGTKAPPAGGAKAPKTGVRELTERPIIRRTALVAPPPTAGGVATVRKRNLLRLGHDVRLLEEA
jgi:hypothetical protein